MKENKICNIERQEKYEKNLVLIFQGSVQVIHWYLTVPVYLLT